MRMIALVFPCNRQIFLQKYWVGHRRLMVNKISTNVQRMRGYLDVDLE